MAEGETSDRLGGTVVANSDQADAWNGPQGAHWAANDERYNRSIRRHTRRLLEAARIAAAERVLDVGCGCGETTREAARLASPGRALGVDLSAPMLAVARQRSQAEGLANVSFEQADAQVHPFPEQAFDLLLSRFGVMFFADRVAAFANLRRALRPGGRLALLSWQRPDQNEWMVAIRGALAAGRVLPGPPVGGPGPFGLAEPDKVRRELAAAGFAAVELESVRESFEAGADVEAAFRFASAGGPARGMLDGLDERGRASALEALRRTLTEHDTGQGVLFGSAAWLITARRP